MDNPNIEKMKVDKDVEGLIEALRDEDENVRLGAVRALGEVRDERAVEPLIKALKEKEKLLGLPTEQIPWLAALALGKIGEPAIEPLKNAIRDEDNNVRLGAVSALGKMRDARAIKILIEVLKDRNEDVQKRRPH